MISRKRKVRGHKRRWRAIEKWIASYKSIDIDRLKECERTWVKVRVSPWTDFSGVSDRFREPRGTTKIKLLKGLIEIYRSWKEILDEHQEPYYLKIWLYEPRFPNSQVVCAVRESIDFYKNTFNDPGEHKTLNPDKYGRLSPAIAKFTWDYRIDEDSFETVTEDDRPFYASFKDYEEDRKWSVNMLSKADRIQSVGRGGDGSKIDFFITRGDIWLGQYE